MLAPKGTLTHRDREGTCVWWLYRVWICGSCFSSPWVITYTIKLTVLIYNLISLSTFTVLDSHHHFLFPEPLLHPWEICFSLLTSITPHKVPTYHTMSPHEVTTAKTGSLSHVAGRWLSYTDWVIMARLPQHSSKRTYYSLNSISFCSQAQVSRSNCDHRQGSGKKCHYRSDPKAWVPKLTAAPTRPQLLSPKITTSRQLPGHPDRLVPRVKWLGFPHGWHRPHTSPCFCVTMGLGKGPANSLQLKVELPFHLFQCILFLHRFLFTYMCMCLWVYVHHVSTGAQGSWTGVTGSCEHLLWVLTTEPGSCDRAANALNLWPSAPVSSHQQSDSNPNWMSW